MTPSSSLAPVPKPARAARAGQPGRAVGTGPLAAWVHGEHGPLVVAVHGLVESSRYWHAVTGRLGREHRVLAADLLGFGRSPWPQLGYTVEAHADALAATLGPLTGGEPALVVAHQAGVPIALAYAARHPGAVRGIVGLGTPWYRTTMEARRALRGPWWLARWLVEHETRARLLCRTLCGGRPIVPRVARMFASDAIPAEVVHDAFLHHWESLSGTLRSCWTEAGLPERYRRLPVPFLALHGDDDVAVPVENLHDAAADRPWMGVEVVAGRGFNLALEDPDLVATAVAETARRWDAEPARARLRPAPPGELTVAEAAALARCHRRSVLSWIQAGSVRARRQGNRLIVDRASLVRYLVGETGPRAEELLARPWATAADAAAHLGVSHATLARLLRAGLPSHRVAGRRIFLVEEIDGWRSTRPG